MLEGDTTENLSSSHKDGFSLVFSSKGRRTPMRKTAETVHRLSRRD